MIKLASRRTYKNKKFNKPHIATKLDKIANNVAKRGVYIVVKTDPGFNIINYITKEVVIENIPYSNIANTVNNTLNASKEKLSVHNYQTHIDRYYKHFNDIQFYKHTLDRTYGSKVHQSVLLVHTLNPCMVYVNCNILEICYV